jgi:hypothetical protein
VRALLRFQAVALARAFDAPAAVVLLAMLAVVVTLAASIGDIGMATLAFAFSVGWAIWGMSRTFDAIDAVRWIAPVRRDDVLRAHVAYWLSICAPPAAIIAIAHAHDVLAAAILFLHLSLTVVAAATIVLFLQRVSRRGAGVGGVVVGIVVPSILISPTTWSFYLAWQGEWTSLAVIGAIACICVALGGLPFLREDLAPSATGPVSASRLFRSDADRPIAARSPVANLLRATYRPLRTLSWVAFGGVLPLLVPSLSVVCIYTPLAATNLAGLGLQTWRWLAATPIDRDRAFRILFGPALAFVPAAPPTRLVVVEVTSDRSAFFDDYRKHETSTDGPETLRLYKLLDRRPDGRSYLPPEIPVIATRVQRHLRESYGLEIPEERIAADVVRGWPEHPSTGIMDSDQIAVLEAMERVRVDLADEIAGAGRRRDFVIAGALVLAFLVMLRAQFRARPLGVLVVLICVLPLSTLSVFRRNLPAIAEATDHAYVALIGASPAVVWILVVAACALGVFLWHSARKAFRRIDVLDIPPNPLASSKR